MNRYTDRPVVVYDLPLPDDAIIINPHQVILRFANAGSLDIGALCYLQREVTPRESPRRPTEGRKVLFSSKCLVRVKHIRAFIAHVSNETRRGKKRSATIHGQVGEFIRFMNWADTNGHPLAMDPKVTRFAVVDYAAHVRERVAAHAISLNSGAATQSQVFSLLGDFLGIENLTRGINLLRKNYNATTSTTPPSEADQGRVMHLCEALFNGLSTLVIDEQPYPFGITMPPNLGYPGNLMWVFPTKVWCLPVSRLTLHGRASHGFGYDYYAGRLATRDEVLTLDKYVGKNYRAGATEKNVTAMLKNALCLMKNANSSPLHPHRRQMGILALNSFLPLFLSRTGMNWAQAVELSWTGGYKESVSTIRQKFRCIKFRAGNKVVSFQLPLRFMPLFRRFLQLRDYLLQGFSDFEGLFFTMGRCSVGAPAYLRTKLPVTFRMFERIDPALVPVLSRGWRSAKGDWSITRTDISTTARILQNSESTVRKSYAAGSVETHQKEMSTFLDRMFVDKDAGPNESSITAVGACTSYGNPDEIAGTVALAPPNCQNPEVGCLFCSNYKVHADELDVRKLLSCQYCLKRTSHLSGFHSMSEPLIERIQVILDAVHSRDASLVPRITKEVAEGELDPYWASKYDMLLRLRLVNDTE